MRFGGRRVRPCRRVRERSISSEFLALALRSGAAAFNVVVGRLGPELGPARSSRFRTKPFRDTIRGYRSKIDVSS